MTVYRLAQTQYINDLSGYGAFLYGGRWNPPDSYMLYTASSVSLALLELLVNLPKKMIPNNYSLAKIELPDVAYPTISTTELPPNWKKGIKYTQQLGEAFLTENLYLFKAVPSAVVDNEYYYIINPKHKQFGKVNILNVAPFNFDQRLLGK
jgi:RES domain-containing protein